jgi:pyruvate dehydrogenase E2 component (dihydrolipoamide acetyltransferase)
MAFVFNFPDVGEGIHEGRVVEWLVSEGDEVSEDQPLVKVETDKAVVELPSPRAGTVLALHAATEADIHVGDPLVTIGEPGEEVEAPRAEPSGAEAPPAEPPPAAAAVDTPSGPTGTARRPLATPRTRALARRKGVDLASISGSGPGGRITDEDVERAAAAPAAPSSRPATAPTAPITGRADVTDDGPVERVKISHLRKVIAGAMRTSKQVSAHVTHVDEADVTELVRAYRDLKPSIEAEGVKFSMLPFFLKGVVAATQKYPMFNASVDENRGEIVIKRYHNVGIAVDTDQGLIVPVIRDVDRKDMVTLAREVADLADRARQRQLGLDELKGGGITITNIGPLGGVFATPIINQPELAIVGLHRIQQRPVVVGGEIVVRDMMYLSVSFDHRWIDGADGARFMTELVGLVSDPRRLLVRL